ncbi:MAG: cadherin repeat domain-containing protein [Bacteroidota bacterium]
MKEIFLLFLLLAAIFFCSCEENINPPEVGDQQFTTNENTPAGTIIGVVQAYDLDPGQTLFFRIKESDNTGSFEVDPGGGHITVADPTMLDYETNTELGFTILVTDDGKPPMETAAKITILLKDENEFAPVVEDQVFEIQEGAVMGALIGVILASDQEQHQPLRFTILSGNEGNVFALDDETGALTVNDPAAFDTGVNTQLILTVLVRDLHIDSKTDTALITVNINPE